MKTCFQWLNSNYQKTDNSNVFLVHLHKEILLINKKRWTTHIHSHIDKSHMPYANWKKPDSKGYILYNSSSMTFQKWQNNGNMKQSSSHQGLRMGRREVYFLRLMKLFCILIVLVAIWQCVLVKTHRTVHQKCEFYCRPIL